MVKNWVKKTSDNFRFTAKFPKVITHDKYLVDVEDEEERFLENIKPTRRENTCSSHSTPSFNGDNARTRESKKFSSFVERQV